MNYGLIYELYNAVEMIVVCKNEIDKMLNIFDSLDDDGFSVSKMLVKL